MELMFTLLNIKAFLETVKFNYPNIGQLLFWKCLIMMMKNETSHCPGPI